jgi:hypothetical protein
MELLAGGGAERLIAGNPLFLQVLFLNGAHVNAKSILRLAQCWCKSMMLMPHVNIAKLMKTATNWYKITRRICMLKVVNEKQSQIGGRGCFSNWTRPPFFKKINVGRVIIYRVVYIVGDLQGN